MCVGMVTRADVCRYGYQGGGPDAPRGRRVVHLESV